MALNDLPEGTLIRHPDWPAVRRHAIRTAFRDDSGSGCTAWLEITSGTGIHYRIESQVDGWLPSDLTDITP